MELDLQIDFYILNKNIIIFLRILFNIGKIINQNIQTNKILKNINQTLEFLAKPENVSLTKKVIIDKLIIFINTLITIQSNREINKIIQDFLETNLAKPYTTLSDKTILQEIAKNYKVQLEKYTIEKMIPKLLETSKGSLSGIKIALNEINTIGITKPTEKKLLLNLVKQLL